MTYRQIKCRVLFDWGIDGSYTDESDNLVRCSGDSRFAPPEAFIVSSSGIVDRAEITLYNKALRYSPLYGPGALYSSIAEGKSYHVPVRIDTSINGGTNWQRVFTGVTQIPKETGRTYKDMPIVTFECRSRDELLRQMRTSTLQTKFKQIADGGYTEADIIREFLLDASMTEGVDFILDKGLQRIRWAWMDDESPLEDIWKLAAAAGGRVYYDHNGVLRYENASHWLTPNTAHTVSQETYDHHDWKRIEVWYEDAEIFNKVTVEYSGRKIDDSAVIWEPEETVFVPAGATEKVTATFGSPAYTQPTITFKAGSAGGADLTSYVLPSVTWYAQRADISFQNTHPTLGATINPFEISARVASGGPTTDETRTSSADGVNQSFFTTRGTRTRSLRGLVYVQGKSQAGMLAQFLLDRHEKPRLMYKLNDMLGNGNRRLGDRIAINEVSMRNGLNQATPREALVTGIAWRFENMSYTMSLEAIDAENLYPYVDDAIGYFVIGNTGNQLGAAHPNRGRLFY